MSYPSLRQVCVIAVLAWATAFPAGALDLPQREGPTPRTTGGVPHVQMGVTPDPAINRALLARARAFDGIRIRPTIVSMPGADGFWIRDELPLAHPEVIVRGREFAHMHPDGSLHASLSPGLAALAVQKGWATPHPWAHQRPGWEGFVMIYTPRTEAEVDVVFGLISDAFTFITSGQTSVAQDHAPAPSARPDAPRQNPATICSTC